MEVNKGASSKVIVSATAGTAVTTRVKRSIRKAAVTSSSWTGMVASFCSLSADGGQSSDRCRREPQARGLRGSSPFKEGLGRRLPKREFPGFSHEFQSPPPVVFRQPQLAPSPRAVNDTDDHELVLHPVHQDVPAHHQLPGCRAPCPAAPCGDGTPNQLRPPLARPPRGWPPPRCHERYTQRLRQYRPAPVASNGRSLLADRK